MFIWLSSYSVIFNYAGTIITITAHFINRINLNLNPNPFIKSHQAIRKGRLEPRGWHMSWAYRPWNGVPIYKHCGCLIKHVAGLLECTASVESCNRQASAYFWYCRKWNPICLYVNRICANNPYMGYHDYAKNHHSLQYWI